MGIIVNKPAPNLDRPVLDLGHGTSKQTKKANSSSSSCDTFLPAKADNEYERTFLASDSRLTKVPSSIPYRSVNALGAFLRFTLFRYFANGCERFHRVANVRVLAAT